jgi:cytochrome bd ubiquinol oxidase subunit I
MDVVLLSRLQFAAATFFHFIFVPLTLGLSLIIAIMETRYVRTNDETFKRMARFWGKLFIINFALGVVTGITLEFQFGTNWARYSAYVGSIFGPLLAIEATMFFFLESTFLAVWIFGWDRISPKLHAACIWIVAIASFFSALWIILANGWMQNPVGYVLRDGRAELESFVAVLTNSFGWNQFIHTVSGSLMLAGFFVMGVSAYHLLRRNETELFNRSFRLGATFALIFSLVVAGQGHFHGNQVAELQPAKLAAMESHWETEKRAPMYLLQVPNMFSDGNMIQAIPLPGVLSFLAYNDFDAEVKGLNEWPESERPPVFLTFMAFRGMVGLGTLFIVLSVMAFFWRNKLQEKRWLLKTLIWVIPLPYIALQLGWIVAEVGRQPWIVYGLMKTSDAVSPVATHQVATSLLAFIVVYTLLGVAAIYLLRKYAIKGPAPESA